MKSENVKAFIFSAGMLLATCYILSSFIPAFIWGAILALSFWDLHEKIKYKSNTSLIVALVSTAIVGPLVYIALQITQAYTVAKDFVFEVQKSGFAFPKFLEHAPFAENLKELWDKNIKDSQGLQDLTSTVINGPLLSKIPDVGAEITAILFMLVCAITVMYFILANKENVVKNANPLVSKILGPKAHNALVASLQVVKSTINGVVAIGLLEGLLLSIPLVAGGVKAGVLIGFVAGIFGVIPLVLPLLIVPCILYFYYTGQYFLAVSTLGCLIAVWFVFENIYKPKLISNAARVHPLLVLIAMIGGLQTIGLLGLFIGPALVAGTVGIIKEYSQN